MNLWSLMTIGMFFLPKVASWGLDKLLCTWTVFVHPPTEPRHTSYLEHKTQFNDFFFGHIMKKCHGKKWQYRKDFWIITFFLIKKQVERYQNYKLCMKQKYIKQLSQLQSLCVWNCYVNRTIYYKITNTLITTSKESGSGTSSTSLHKWLGVFQIIL